MKCAHCIVKTLQDYKDLSIIIAFLFAFRLYNSEQKPAVELFYRQKARIIGEGFPQKQRTALQYLYENRRATEMTHETKLWRYAAIDVTQNIPPLTAGHRDTSRI